MTTKGKNCKWKCDQAIPPGRSISLRHFFGMEIEKSLLFIYYFLLLQLISCSSMAQSARMGSIGLHVNIVPQSILERRKVGIYKRKRRRHPHSISGDFSNKIWV
jgi:hypothetical protein